MEEWASTDFSNAEAIVVFVLSHGGVYGSLFGTDNEIVEVDSLVSTFSKKLVDVPTFFFLQACRGEHDTAFVEVPTFKRSESKMKTAGVDFDEKYHNTFLFYCTNEGRFIHRLSKFPKDEEYILKNAAAPFSTYICIGRCTV